MTKIFSLNRRTLLGRIAPLVALAIGGMACALPAHADDSPPAVKIAIANPGHIAQSTQEIKDMNLKMEFDRKAIQDEADKRQNNLKSIKQQLDFLKVGAPQYQETEDKFLKASIEYDVWVKEQELDLQRKMKTQTKQLFVEIENAIAAVAQKKGYNLVIADQRPDIPDDLTPIDLPTLLRLISQRTVLYSDQKFDIDGDVITMLDEQYASRMTPPAPKP